MDYVDSNGTEHHLVNNSKFLNINNNDEIIQIIGFSNKIKYIVISNNKNLKSIINFPLKLTELHIINNNELDTLHIPKITTQLEIYNNPKLTNIDEIIDNYKKTEHYKKFFHKIVTEPYDSDDEESISIISELNKEDLIIDDWLFTTNVDDYKTSPNFLKNNDKHLISYKDYNGYFYPIITIPKGTILYTYGKGNNISLKDKYHNIYNLEEGTEFESQLKFFYPLPYAAELGINSNYNICNIVTTNNDIQLICLLSPAPQSNETLRLYSKNKVVNEQFENINYYNNNLTLKCETYDHDLCINLKMMKEMNIQGYICISEEDSISHGKKWYKNMDKEGMKNYAEFIEEYLFNSCLSSIYKENNNLNYINENLNIKIPDNIQNRMFGIPEIVIVPLKTEYFYNINQDKILETFHDIIKDDEFNNSESKIFNIFKNMFNYQVLEICALSELKDYLEKIENNILSNKQYNGFQLFSEELVIKEISTNLHYDKLNFDDVNYVLSYLNKNKKNPYCAFETIGYHLLKNQTGGKRKTFKNTKPLLKKTRSIQKYKKRSLFTKSSRKVINITGGENNTKIIFEKTKGGIPIVYTIPLEK
jgi:hypothetical protein